MKFRFRYEEVLKHRCTLENLAKREYWQAQNQVFEEELKLTTLYKGETLAIQQRHQIEKQGGLQSEMLQQICYFIEGQKALIQNQKKNLADVKSLAEEKLEILHEAMKERNILEKLKERANIEFKQIKNKKDKKEDDDMNLMRSGWRESS